MIKKLRIIIGLVFFSVNSWAQASEGTVKLGKADEPAIIMVYDYPEKVVDAAFTAKLTDKQLKGTRNKGFTSYPNSLIKEISKSNLDYYFKLEENKAKTTVYLIMHGSGNIEGADQLATRGKLFLENMLSEVKRSHNIVQIKKQEEILVDEERRLMELQNAQKEIEEKIAKNKAEQDAQQKIIASQKALLEDLKTKNF